MQDKWGHEIVRELEFDRELAGQRVGWIALSARGKTDDLHQIHVVTTTIGPEGAHIQHEPRPNEDPPRKAYWTDGVMGFQATVALSMLIDVDEKPAEQTYKEISWTLGENGLNSLYDAADGHNDREELDRMREWQTDPTELMPRLKALMTERGIEDYFPLAYYTANMLVAHESFKDWAFYRSLSSYGRNVESMRDVPKETLLLPDPDMAGMTSHNVELAKQVVEAYDTQISQDVAMRTNLTAFGAVPAAEITGEFVRSRRIVGKAEAGVYNVSQQIPTYLGVYMPIDSKSIDGSRTWPYIDATQMDEDRAFGHELQCLQNGNIDFVSQEIKRELAELEGRRQYAARGVQALQLLSRAEQG